MVVKHLEKADSVIGNLRWIVKRPSGSAPRAGLEWKEETHRWVRPSNGASKRSKTSPFGYFSSRPSNKLLTREELPFADYWAEQNFNPTESPSYAHRAVVRQNSNSVISLMRPLGEFQILYRGINSPLLEFARTGSILDLDTLLSCSRKPSVAFNANPTNGTLFEIYAGPNTIGVTVLNDVSETILAYGQSMIVDDVRNIDVQEVNDIYSIKLIIARIGYDNSQIGSK